MIGGRFAGIATAQSRSPLNVFVRLANLLGMLFGKLHEFVDARRAAELILLPIHDPRAFRVGLGLRHRANQVARMRVHVVYEWKPRYFCDAVFEPFALMSAAVNLPPAVK